MRYALPMRPLHWTMAVIIIGMLWAGLTMVSMDDAVPAKFELFYPWHKSFGMLIPILVLVRLAIRARSTLPALPQGL
jgi:cytochrome b561